MDQFFDDSLRSMPLGVAAVRLLSAIVLGGLIGWEREASERPAGLRTHMLISLAAATFAILGMELTSFEASDGTELKTDPLRLIESVTSGVAFLAAGSIIFSGGSVRGITTGASMWLCGAIGLSCGIGDLWLGLMTTMFALAVLWLLRRVVNKVEDAAPDSDDAEADEGEADAKKD